MKAWERMPTLWIRSDALPLTAFKWRSQGNADQIAALILYMVMVHHVNDAPSIACPEVGMCNLTYDQLSEITGISRAKIAGGIVLLEALGVIVVDRTRRNSSYLISHYGEQNRWGKLPARRLYTSDGRQHKIFREFHLRSKVELNALKIYLLIVCFRDNSLNCATIGFEKITQYTGMTRNDIKPATSLLVTLGLIRVESAVSQSNEQNTMNVYRLCYLDTTRHRGTTGGTPTRENLAEVGFE